MAQPATTKQALIIADVLSLKENQDLTKNELIQLITPYLEALYTRGVRRGRSEAIGRIQEATLNMTREIVEEISREEMAAERGEE